MNPEDKAHCEKLLQECVDKLSEHCDSVRIFITLPTGDGESNTAAMDRGSGNFYAQLGQITEWLCIQEQYQRNWAVRNDEEKNF
jgi:hypothetical protein